MTNNTEPLFVAPEPDAPRQSRYTLSGAAAFCLPKMYVPMYWDAAKK